MSQTGDTRAGATAVEYGSSVPTMVATRVDRHVSVSTIFPMIRFERSGTADLRRRFDAGSIATPIR
jgi:hypothetical protein